jgi:hypothetical protein
MKSYQKQCYNELFIVAYQPVICLRLHLMKNANMFYAEVTIITYIITPEPLTTKVMN